MTQHSTRRSAFASCALLGLAASGLMAVPAASANDHKDHTARVVNSYPSASVKYVQRSNVRPLIAQVDTTGDGKANAMAYCVESTKTASRGVMLGRQTMRGYHISHGKLRDVAGVKRVAMGGYPTRSAADLAQAAGVAGKTSARDMQYLAAAATQAALYKYANGLTVQPGFRYDRRTTAQGAVRSEIFTKLYAHIVTWNGTVTAGLTWRVLDSRPGEAGTQTLLEIPKVTPDPDPKPDPKTTPTPTPTPTNSSYASRNKAKANQQEADQKAGKGGHGGRGGDDGFELGDGDGKQHNAGDGKNQDAGDAEKQLSWWDKLVAWFRGMTKS